MSVFSAKRALMLLLSLGSVKDAYGGQRCYHFLACGGLTCHQQRITTDRHGKTHLNIANMTRYNDITRHIDLKSQHVRAVA